MRPIIRLFLLILIATTTAGVGLQVQAADIAGLVTIEGTQKPVMGVQLLLEPGQMTATSDAKGRFEFKGVADGAYTLHLSHPDFKNRSVQVKVKGKKTIKMDLVLTANKNDNYKVVVDSVGSLKDKDNRKSEFESAYQVPAPVPDATRQTIRSTGEVALDVYMGNGAQALQPQMLQKETRRRPTETPYGIVLQPGYCTPQPEDMQFRDYGTNRFVSTRVDPLSTFALDVDDGSFNIVKEYLERGTIPPTDAIRVEEFINHFDYGYADPVNRPFRLFTELVPSPTDRELTILKIGMKARELPDEERQPMNLTFVIDVSGSMRLENRLYLVKQSLGLLLDQLDSRDKIGIVAYGSTARVLLNPISAGRKDLIMQAVNGLYPNGSTFAEAGLKLGYQIANSMYDRRRINRVILCSDGVANVGKVSPDAIMADISEFARKGITLSTFGYGMGNYNDVLLEQLAIRGDGRYAYVNDRDEAVRLFVKQFTSNMSLLARDAKIQVSFDPRVVQSYRLIGYENRAVADNRFRDNSQDGGEIGPGHEITAVYELKLIRGQVKRQMNSLGNVTLRWTAPNEREVAEISREIELDGMVSRFESARPELRLAVVASQFAGLLKRTPYDQNVSYRFLIEEARTIDRQMNTDQTRELVSLIEMASGVDDDVTPWDDYFSRF